MSRHFLPNNTAFRNHAVEVSLKKMTAEGVVNKYPGLGYSVVVKLKFPRATQIPTDGEEDTPSRQVDGSVHMNGTTAFDDGNVDIICCP